MSRLPQWRDGKHEHCRIERSGRRRRERGRRGGNLGKIDRDNRDRGRGRSCRRRICRYSQRRREFGGGGKRGRHDYARLVLGSTLQVNISAARERYLLLLAISVGLAGAQTGTFTGPVAGYVFDGGAHSLRPLLGIPGAATVGAPIDAGYSFTAAYVAPRQDSFFGVAADGSTHWFAIAAGALTETAIAGVMQSPERVVFSPTGTAAALFANGQAQIVTGLRGSPAAAGSISLSSTDARRRIAAPRRRALSSEYSRWRISASGAERFHPIGEPERRSAPGDSNRRRCGDGVRTGWTRCGARSARNRRHSDSRRPGRGDATAARGRWTFLQRRGGNRFFRRWITRVRSQRLAEIRNGFRPLWQSLRHGVQLFSGRVDAYGQFVPLN